MDSPAGPFVFSRGGPDILDVTVTYARDSFCGFTQCAVSSRGGAQTHWHQSYKSINKIMKLMGKHQGQK